MRQRHRVNPRGPGSRLRCVAWAVCLLVMGMCGCRRPGKPNGPAPAPRSQTASARQLNWRGIAFLERFDYQRAAEQFRQAAAIDPKSVTALTNLGLACYYQGGPALAEARESLGKALKLAPDTATALYALALVELQGGAEEGATRAVQCLEHVARLRPHDDLVQAQLGMAYERLEKHEQAQRAFERALADNPNNATAHWRLGQLLLANGEREAGLAHLATHGELSGRPEAVALGKKYGEVGEVGLALREGQPVERRLPFETTFSEATKEAGLPARGGKAAGVTAAVWLDVESEGGVDLLVADAAGAVRLWVNDGRGNLTPFAGELPKPPGPVTGFAVGDVDRLTVRKKSPTDAGPGELAPSYPEVFVCSANGCALWHNRDGKGFEARLPAAGETWPAARRAAFVDYDHEGDLDLVLLSPTGRLRLLQNATKSFVDVTTEAQLGEVQAQTVAFLDTDRDRAIDLLTAGQGGVGFWRNNWNGSFTGVDGAWGFGDLPATQLLLPDDATADGHPELLLAPVGGGAQLCTVAGRGEITTVDLPAPQTETVSAAAWGDFDCDGLTDLVMASSEGAGPTTLTLLRNLGGRFEDVTSAASLAELTFPAVNSLAPADVDADGDLDLLVAGETGLALLRNETHGRNWLEVALIGRHSNAGGVGAKVELFSAAGQACHYVTGEREDTLHFGLGQSKSVDWLRVTWPSGIVQSEIEVQPNQRLTLRELDRKPTSCPVLYAHDGKRGFEFLTDCLGNGIIGYLLARGEYCPWDPDEYVRVPDQRLGEVDGKYLFELADQLEEVLFIDQVQLLTVDHPEGTWVYSSDLMRCGPPYPEHQLYVMDRLQPVAAAHDSDGDEVRDLVAEADRRYVEDFPLRHDFDGYAFPHSLTLDLGEVGDASRVWLLIEGYLEYAHSSANLAASQAGVTCYPPLLEAPDGRGGWRVVQRDVGLVAGLTKEIAVEVTNWIRADDPRLRLRTDMPFFIDRVRVGVATHDVSPTVHPQQSPVADYHWLGYPQPRHPQGKEPVTYDYSRRRDWAPFQTPLGNYTRLGDVSSLLARADDQPVIMRHGHAIRLAFDAPLRKPGLARTCFFYINGVGKDMDMNGAFANTVLPLPYAEMPGYQPGTALTFPWTPARARSALAFQTLDQRGSRAAPAVVPPWTAR